MSELRHNPSALRRICGRRRAAARATLASHEKRPARSEPAKQIRPDQIHPTTRNEAMKNDRPEPNAELHSFEPLRITFAVLALLLGLIAALHV
jgi:hypothetical protein